jgi:hypothetical protein
VFGGLRVKEKTGKNKSLSDMWTFSSTLGSPLNNVGDHEGDHVGTQNENKIVAFDPSFIPVEIWCSILSYLIDSGRSIAAASVVSKQFFNIIKYVSYYFVIKVIL